MWVKKIANVFLLFYATSLFEQYLGLQSGTKRELCHHNRFAYFLMYIMLVF